MQRVLTPIIQKDLSNRKIILISGPRQSGKTTLAQMLSSSYDYVNYDAEDHRLQLKEKSWDRKKDLVIFDELHKMPKWKSWLKGIHDTENVPPHLVVTGSAKLNIYKKMGDSLAGRHYSYRLHPLDLREVREMLNPPDMSTVYDTLIAVGGFPEPFLNGSVDHYKRWKRTHLDIILRQDLLDLESVRNIKSMETLIALLRRRVGSQVSYQSLTEDLQCDSKTVKRWLSILEDLFVIFRVTPYSKNIARSLLKESKYYFFDCGQIEGDESAKLENLVASSLFKALHFLEDTTGSDVSLHYLRTKEKREIDFMTLIDTKVSHMIEVKLSDDTPVKAFQHFNTFLPPQDIQRIQLVKNLSREKTYPNGIEVRNAISWLSQLTLTPR